MSSAPGPVRGDSSLDGSSPGAGRPKEVTLVRHGESTFNVTGTWQGHGDAPLSPKGEQQARAVGERLSKERYDRVVSSDLQRAHNTALASGHEVETLQEWREIDVGRWEGMTRPEVRDRFPEEIAALMRGEDLRIGGGESWADLHARVGGALSRLLESLPDGGRAAVFAHGGVIASIVSGQMALRDTRPRPVGRISNTAVTRLRFWPDGAVDLVGFNDASHAMPRPAWATEMHEQGAGLATVITTPNPTGLQRGALDALNALVDGRDGLSTAGEVLGQGLAAAAVADHLGLPLKPPRGTLEERLAVGAARSVHVLEPETLRDFAAATMEHGTSPSGPSVLGPDGVAVTRVIRTSKGCSFADYASAL